MVVVNNSAAVPPALALEEHSDLAFTGHARLLYHIVY